MKIDVVIPTKNSVKPCWKKCLDSIYNSDIPLNRVIIIDSCSTDKTLEIAKKYPKVKIIEEAGNLAEAREFGISLVKTKWFAFIDSDVIIPNNWFSEIWKYSKYGNALESWNWNWTNVHKFEMKKTKNGITFMTSYRNQSDRARTIATLIETKFVKGIKIPRELIVLEDEYIRKFLEKRHGVWIKTGVKIDHYPNEWNLNNIYLGYLYGKFKLCSFSTILFKALGNMIIKNEPYSYYWKIIIGFIKGRVSNEIH